MDEGAPAGTKRRRPDKVRGSKKKINKGPVGRSIKKVSTEKSGKKLGKSAIFKDFCRKIPEFYVPNTPVSTGKAKILLSGEIPCTPTKLLQPPTNFSSKNELLSILSEFTIEEKLAGRLLTLMIKIDQKFADLTTRLQAYEATNTAAPHETYAQKVSNFQPILPGPSTIQAQSIHLPGTPGLHVPGPCSKQEKRSTAQVSNKNHNETS
ncbi:hypothetical protein AVEN_78608-1 [Araneus ventricosus]|uniref:Uncharacterized protein n=1 Tax=Araneus ventricosus TaxID=182803 RepID=A0A4Y2G128_ARAVE|nr:hypothetical protein AVEN_78608-1 [Araneus ventricosus]